jgi:hypothetical protein
MFCFAVIISFAKWVYGWIDFRFGRMTRSARFAAVHFAIRLFRPTPQKLPSPKISTQTRTFFPGISSGFL